MEPLKAAGNYLVVDDICDGGGTFNLLAEAFQKDPHAAKSDLSLYVSHGIFSKGIRAINDRYVNIFTTDSWCRKPWDVSMDLPARKSRLYVLSLQPVIDCILEDANV
jgi:hypoxanthine phosphoribosyltransferase